MKKYSFDGYWSSEVSFNPFDNECQAIITRHVANCHNDYTIVDAIGHDDGTIIDLHFSVIISKHAVTARAH